MKKVLMAVLAVFIGIAFVTSVFAQSQTDVATKAAKDAACSKNINNKYNETSMANPPQKLTDIFTMQVTSLTGYVEKRMIR